MAEHDERLYRLYMESLDEEEKAKKESVPPKETYYFKTHLIPIVSEAFKKTANRDKLVAFVGKFLSDNSKALATSGPMYNFSFSEKDANELYAIFGLSKEKVLEMFDTMAWGTYGYDPKVFQAIRISPHKILITAMIIDGLINKYEDVIECCEYLCVLVDYPMVFVNSFPKSRPKEDVMEYTIEHLPNKFIIKKQKNLLGMLRHIGKTGIVTFSDRLIGQWDIEYANFINQIRRRLTSAIANIAEQYYKNYGKNATLHTHDGKMDDGSFTDTEGGSTNVAQVSETTYNKFVVNDVNASMIKICAENGKLDPAKLSGYVNQIYKDKDNRLAKFIENLVILFNNDDEYRGSPVGSKEFLNFALALFRSIGTSKSKPHEELRNILNHWTDITGLRTDYSREQTIIVYRRGIYNYFVFMIRYYN